MAPLDSYLQLRGKVDALCRQIESAHAEVISCQAGCDSCCQALTLFPVEAYALARAVAAQPEPIRQRLRARAGEAADTESCPLLTSVDFCPLNFVGCDSLSGNSLIDLDRLNQLLAAINHDFVARNLGSTAPPDRIPIGEALLLPWPPPTLVQASS